MYSLQAAQDEQQKLMQHFLGTGILTGQYSDIKIISHFAEMPKQSSKIT
jgi:hypothetical protein